MPSVRENAHLVRETSVSDNTENPYQEGTLKVKASKRRPALKVTDRGEGLAGHAGSRLVADMADRCGLSDALSAAMAPTRTRRSGHDPGGVLVDVAVMLADGGKYLSDLAVLRDQPELFGPVASTPTAWRVLDSVDDERLGAIRAARARARAAVWAAGGDPGYYVLDFDATLLTAHSDKEQAAPNYKHGFGFHPLLCYLDGTGEALAGILRPGNAGSNTAADHVQLLDLALAQLPVRTRVEDPEQGVEILARADSAGCTHGFLDACRARGVRFSVGFDLTATVALAALAVPAEDWVEAVDQDGQVRDGAWVAEITDRLDLSGWPEGSRALVRRERPHPGAQLTFTDVDGHRYQAILTDQDDADLAYLEARHRGHARVENRIRDAKDTGMRNLPLHAFAANAAWLECVLLAQDLLAWTQGRCFEGELARAEPRRLRYLVLHVAARLARSGRRTRLHVQHNWPWAGQLVAAFDRLEAIAWRDARLAAVGLRS